MAKSISDIEFADLLRRHHARLFGFIRSMVLHADDAQDVYQETVLALWQYQESFDPAGEFSRWAVGVARNKVFDYFKLKQREGARFSDAMLELLVHRQAEQSEDAEFLAARERALAGCLKTIDDAQAVLLRRCYEEGETVAEVAASMNRTPGSVYSSLHHIRGKLLACIRGKLQREYDHV